MRGSNKDGLSGDPDRITYGSNSGYQAIHLAYNMGATTILLLGYDYGGNTHFFGDHPQPLRAGHDYKAWLSSLNVLAADLKREGVEVINCSRETAIKCFKRTNIVKIPNN